MRNEGRRNEAEARRRNLLVTATEIEDDRRVHRQKLQDIGKKTLSQIFIYVRFSVCTSLLHNIRRLMILDDRYY